MNEWMNEYMTGMTAPVHRSGNQSIDYNLENMPANFSFKLILFLTYIVEPSEDEDNLVTDTANTAGSLMYVTFSYLP